MALNHMITGNWEQAASSFETLCKLKYWSAAFCKYMEGACLEMIPGKRSEAILAFAQVPSLVVKKLGGRMGDMDSYALHKVQAFQQRGYQDMDYYAPALEFLCIWNLFPYMNAQSLEQCHRVVNRALECIQIQEQEEYDIRSQELAPETPPPDHFDQRAVLLLIKASIQNATGISSAENTILLNWIVDHKDNFASDTWVVPYALWELALLHGMSQMAIVVDTCGKWHLTFLNMILNIDWQYDLIWHYHMPKSKVIRNLFLNLSMTRSVSLSLYQPWLPRPMHKFMQCHHRLSLYFVFLVLI